PIIGIPPKRAAQPMIFAASMPDADPTLYWGPTRFTPSRGPVACPSSGLSKNRELWRRLWEESEKMTGVTYNL
ncbi:MAG TPA: short-chain dehydrogenase, partial [Mycobacterium sp.]|nr:short-chain dehydrogenase [Mycobacterium sp.]